jgi:restriction system protein
MPRHSTFGRIIVGMAREAARAQRRAKADMNRQARDQARAIRAAARTVAVTAKQTKQRYLGERIQEAEELNLQLSEHNEELRTILSRAIDVTASSVFESMRLRIPYPPFTPPASLTPSKAPPLERTFISKISPPSFIGRLFPSRVGRYKKALEKADEDYMNAVALYDLSERDRKDKLLEAQAEYERGLIAHQARARHQDDQVDTLLASYRNHQPEAVVNYASVVIERSTYPENFPHEYRLVYVPESKQLVLEYQLPPPTIVPTVQEYRYNKTKEVIDQKQLKVGERKEFYQDIVASVALRTLSELFASDDAAAIEVLVFNGYIRAVDPATGRDIQPHLISVRVTKERFKEIDLERVDKLVCLRNLGAQVSPRPYEIQPIKPVIEFNMVDRRFIEQGDVLTSLESRPNLMDLTPTEFEELVANLFQKKGIEAKLTRSHRDGGVDVIGFDTREILGGKVVIQAKRYRNTVAVSAVRDLFGTMQHEGANKGILVTTSGYGPDAFSFAQNKPMELIDGAGLLYLLQEQGINARIDFPEDQSQLLSADTVGL